MGPYYFMKCRKTCSIRLIEYEQAHAWVNPYQLATVSIMPDTCIYIKCLKFYKWVTLFQEYM